MPRIRKTGDGGLYLDKKRGLWIGVVDNGLTPDGKRKQVRVTSKSQATARRKLNELIEQLSSHGSPLGTKSVSEWGAFWLEGYKRGKPQTYRTYMSLFNTWVLPVIGRKQVKDVRASDLRNIYDGMRNAGKSDSTVLKTHNMLSSLFEQARLERLARTNVVKDIRSPRAAKPQRDTFTPEETLKLLRAAELMQDGSKWIVSLYAGIRQGERLGATIDSLQGDAFTVRWNLVEANFDHGCPDRDQCRYVGGKRNGQIRAGGNCPQRRIIRPEGIDYRILEGRLMLVPPKSGEARTFPLPAPLVQILEDHIERLKLRDNPHGLLWPNADGSPMTGREDQDEWDALLAAAEVERPGATTHWARHTAISDLTAAGVAERVTGEIVGHKSPGITGRYQHVASKDSSEAMVKLAERRQLES
jgi:integrase